MKEPTTHELIERYRLHDDMQWRQGFCAAITSTHGRRHMQHIRRLGEARDRGDMDLTQVVAAMQEAFQAIGRGLLNALRGEG